MNRLEQNPLAEDQGRIFEIGFNTGILAYLQSQDIGKVWVDFYQPDLAELRFDKLLSQLLKKAALMSEVNRQIIEGWSELILLRGFLGGVSLAREYLQSQGWKKVQNVEVLYFQCSFVDENSLNTHSKGDLILSLSILGQFLDIVKKEGKDQLQKEINQYTAKGEFLKADTLILWRYQQQYRLLVIDTSIFAVKTSQDLADLEFVELIKQKLIAEINYLRSQSIFSRLKIDTGVTEAYGFAAGIKDYFTALKHKNKNKESLKLIQAGSYAHSFSQYLYQKQILNPEDKLIISAIGYSDRGISSLTVMPENRDLLRNCYQIYRDNIPTDDWKQARQKVLNLIKRQASYSFNQGKDFVNQLLQIPPRQSQLVTHRETLTDFANTASQIPPEVAKQLHLDPQLSLRNGHATLIKQALVSKANYLFLTGNPGIGKTTAIANFLREHLEEGFLFLYISPRIQVNLDIIEKFKQEDKLCDPRLFCLTTNSRTLSNYSHSRYKHVVEYLSGRHQGEFGKKAVQFLPMQQEVTTLPNHPSSLKRKAENTLVATDKYRPGVLASLSEAIYTVINDEISQQIIATAALQSLKTTQSGSTIDHLHNIFQNAYNSTTGSLIPSRLQSISRRVKHLLIMIDEITGSESGVEFLHGLKSFCRRYQLFNPEMGFNTKIIVADASIVEPNVIKQHLEDKSPEPDKIFFRKVDKIGQALTWDEFTFQKQPAVVINANSYPAKSLDITYKVCVEAKEFNPDSYKISKDQQPLIQQITQTLIADLMDLWTKPGQILVYIQDKQKLQRVLTTLESKLGRELQANQDYLEVKANLSETEKQKVHQYKNDPNIKLILMTSAGSRGLSFPYVRHILVQIPSFQAEQNLMEILQVIYRGRGNREIDQQSKQIIFYLAEAAIYYPDSPDAVLDKQETIINILNTLLILKASIMTRIKGTGKLGRHQVVLIPIGGKAITAAGENFSSKINNFLELLAQEYRISPEKINLKNLRQEIQQLLSQADFTIGNHKDPSTVSYLSQLSTFSQQFRQHIYLGLDQLLNFGNWETSYLFGSLMIIPVEAKSVKRDYYVSLKTILQANASSLLAALASIRSDCSYNNNLRHATQEAIDLIREIKTETDNSLQLEESSNYQDQYYAIPLFTLLNLPLLEEYFANQEEEEERSFRQILEYYLKSLYCVSDLLPIGDQYRSFPFILFRSYTLEQIRQKLFTGQYLFNSPELNIINLILSH